MELVWINDILYMALPDFSHHHLAISAISILIHPLQEISLFLETEATSPKKSYQKTIPQSQRAKFPRG